VMKIHFRAWKDTVLKTWNPRLNFKEKCGMSRVLIQILFMNGRDRKVDNKTKSYIWSRYSASSNLELDEASEWLLHPKHQCSHAQLKVLAGCAEMREGLERWGLTTCHIYIYILFCTVEEMKHCKYIHLHRFRSIDSYSMHKTLPQPVLSKNASPHHLPWIQRLFVIIISLKTSSLFPMPTMTSNNNIRTESIAKLFSTLHELSCT
jgi:hypothetical protein